MHIPIVFRNKLYFTGKNLEIGLRKARVLSFTRDLDGNDEDPKCENYLKDASSQATGNYYVFLIHIKILMVPLFILFTIICIPMNKFLMH